MDYKKTALYALAGYVLYVVYQKYVAKPKSDEVTNLKAPQSQADCPNGTKFKVQNGGINSSSITSCVPNIQNCPELYGCGMPGPGVICTGEMQQPIPGCEGISQRRPS
tara:strand:- start:247 stop:570 length:324 start_codon:yes stop_codon:yes gene_type:complete